MSRFSLAPLAITVIILGVCLSALSSARAADKISTPAKAVVQISVTDADALEGKTLPPLVLSASDTQKRDDLSVYESAVCLADLPLVVTPRFSVTTFDGEVGSVSVNTQITYVPVGSTLHKGDNPLPTIPLTSSLSATPRVNSDGTISVDFTLTESKNGDPAKRELGPPTIISQSVTTKMTFLDGETRAFLPIFSGDGYVHFSFLTVKLVPAKKG